ncbi:uncharacterized protein V3H82_011434 [Fundulus diaphanus]
MPQVILYISLLLVHHTTQSHQEVQQIANCTEDVTLDCPAFSSKRKDFFAMTWYKGKEPIIRKRRDEIQPSNFSREAKFGVNLSLFLPNVKPTDSGKYICNIRANVGHQNKEGSVVLSVNECVIQVVEPTPNSTQSKPVAAIYDFPLTWTLAGYLAVAAVKILLSMISIQMIRIVSSRRQKRRFCS